MFLLDYPLEQCLAGAEERVGVKREEMPWVEESFDDDFRQWIIDFPQIQLPQIYSLLFQYKQGRDIIILKSRAETEEYIESLMQP